MKKPTSSISNFDLWLLIAELHHAIVLARQRELSPYNIGAQQLQVLRTIQNLGSANVGPLAMYLYKNGIQFKLGVQWNPTVGYNVIQSMSTTASVYLNGTTDYLQINTSQTATGNTIGGDIVANYFDGILISL